MTGESGVSASSRNKRSERSTHRRYWHPAARHSPHSSGWTLSRRCPSACVAREHSHAPAQQHGRVQAPVQALHGPKHQRHVVRDLTRVETAQVLHLPLHTAGATSQPLRSTGQHHSS
jgi:hypothetical protein